MVWPCTAPVRGGGLGERSRLGGPVIAFLWVLAGGLWGPSVQAQEDEKGRFRVGGLAFGDVYDIPSHHLPMTGRAGTTPRSTG